MHVYPLRRWWFVPLALYLLVGGPAGGLPSVEGSTASRGRTVRPRGAVGQDSPLINAQCAEPLKFAATTPQGVRTPKLQGSTQKPNIIVILTDDQGWDDIGMHNPQYIQTPNIDKFIKQSTMFDNFYVQPECAQSRAELLTGRNFPRTSTMLVHGGYDFIDRDEVTMGKFFSDAGYLTAQIGKWHESEVAGYGPVDAGFEVTWHAADASPDATAAAESTRCFVSHNGKYAGTVAEAASSGPAQKQPQSASHSAPPHASSHDSGLGQTAMINKLFKFLTGYQSDVQQGNETRPLFVYYPPNMIHKKKGLGNGRIRPYPLSYRNRFINNSTYDGVPFDTIDAWANLAYMDDLFGRLFKLLKRTQLADNTYVFMLSDNGAYLTDTELAQGRQYRMPSQMQGFKSTTFEGGIRNFMAVRGPGVPAGVTDSTLLQIIDLLPTIADLAGIPASNDHLPWDGISFKNLLLPTTGSPVAPSGGRRTTLANDAQLNRFVFTLGPACWDADAVAELGPDREVVRPQPLFDYDQGGKLNGIYGKVWWLRSLSSASITAAPGFEGCISVRYKDYKWVGLNRKIYRIVGDDHVELPCNEGSDSEATQAAATMSQAARSWWSSLVSEPILKPHSFVKPTFYLGLPNWMVSNVMVAGAHERTKGNVVLIPNGASGFQDVGDRLCCKVQVVTAADYAVIVMYRSSTAATFRLSLGPYSSIVAGTAQSITTQLLASSSLRGFTMGTFMNVPVTSYNVKTELCFELTSTPTPGQPIFNNLSVFRFIQSAPTQISSPPTTTTPSNSSSSNSSSSLVTQAAGAAANLATAGGSVVPGTTAASSTTELPHQPAAVALPAAEPDLSASSALLQSPSPVTEAAAGTAQSVGAAAGSWAAARAACGWPAGQGVLEHLYSPYVEDMAGCQACQPN